VNDARPALVEAPMPWPPRHTGPVGAPVGYPPAGWPTLGQLVWTKELIVVLLLVLALPWLMRRLLTNPASVLSGVAKRVT
jgi:hypothetical protein